VHLAESSKIEDVSN